MENEQVKIFDEHRNQIGMTTRQEAHKVGYWHETFQCWFVSREDQTYYIYFQIRSATKKDFPNLLDITAAGHLLADETVEDGVREVKEELGIHVSFEKLEPLGVIEDSIIQENFVDREFANVFLYPCQYPFAEYKLQKEEVSGIVKADFNNVYQLWLGDKRDISVEGFEINEDGRRDPIKKTVSKNSFVPHKHSYYESILKWIDQRINHTQT
nr:NUDIX domain-containing protein [Tuberibacillus sp. Marseille-P3662]